MQVKPPAKENVGTKKKLKGGKKELGSEKPSEEREKVPDEHVPLEPEVRLLFNYDFRVRRYS